MLTIWKGPGAAMLGYMAIPIPLALRSRGTVIHEAPVPRHGWG
jgi:hypothetical protein